jgi:phospholipid-binding lipoprotein MlaA
LESRTVRAAWLAAIATRAATATREATVMLAATALCGCALENPSIRRLPPETPAADNAAAIVRADERAAAASQAAARDAAPDAVIPLTAADAPSMVTYDPWARLNRSIYRFNARFDEAIFLPVADNYDRLPSPVRHGVRNFFLNLSEPKSALNYLLQWRPVSGLRSVGRFVVNTTLGIGGLFDVAAHVRLANPLTGFGVTLARWGMHPGPYLVIPLLGPSTLRDGVGLLADYGVSYGINLADLYRGYQSWALGTLNAVNQRAGNDFRYYSSGSPFEYETIRFLYVHRELIQDEALHAKSPPRVRDPGKAAGQ